MKKVLVNGNLKVRDPAHKILFSLPWKSWGCDGGADSEDIDRYKFSDVKWCTKLSKDK